MQSLWMLMTCWVTNTVISFVKVNSLVTAICMWLVQGPGGCFTNVSRALQNNLAKIHNTRNHIYGENFKLKLCTCAQSMALCTRTKFQLEILVTSTISAIHKFRENILESSWNVSETTPWKDNLNPLRAKFFRGNIKHIFTFHVISPHWYDAGSLNPSSNKTRTYLFYIVNIMAADVLAM